MKRLRNMQRKAKTNNFCLMFSTLKLICFCNLLRVCYYNKLYLIKKMSMNRSEIYTVNLDPTIGTEIKKTRPCVIVSPDEMNAHLLTVQVVPLTSKERNIPSRVKIALLWHQVKS